MRSLIFSRKFSTYSSFLLDKLYINGKWTSSSNGSTFSVYNPSNGKILAKAQDCDENDALLAIDAASNAFKTWSRTSGKERSSLIRKLFSLQLENIEPLAKLITMEMGKPIKESRGEINYGASFFEWFSEEAKRIYGNIFETPLSNTMTMYTREPLGPVGIITPWNFPNAMITRKLAAALASGCTTVIKPSEDTPFSALALAKLCEIAGIPDGVVNVITCSRSKAHNIAHTISTSPKIKGLSFTGSTAVGKILLAQGASTIKRISLELGGNAPFIVFNSANINLAIKGCMVAKFRNTGQTCIAANRIFVQDEVHDEFVSKLITEIGSLKVGDPIEETTNIGPLVNERALSKVERHVKDAITKGATKIIGGSKLQNNFFQPTIFTKINKTMDIYNEEIFGPVVAIYKFSNEEDIIEAANDTCAGLVGYFFSSDIGQIFRVARNLEVGMIGVNQGLISCAEAPFGGVKESGIGREGSHLGIEEFTNVKYVCLGLMN